MEENAGGQSMIQVIHVMLGDYFLFFFKVVEKQELSWVTSLYTCVLALENIVCVSMAAEC